MRNFGNFVHYTLVVVQKELYGEEYTSFSMAVVAENNF